MPFLTLAQAKAHLRIDDADGDADLTLKIGAAERAAVEYLQCNVYADQLSLDAAIAAVPAMLSAAKAAYIIADAEADELTDYDLVLDGKAHAMSLYMRAVYAATRTRQGVVINETIQHAVILMTEFYVERREECEAASQRLLDSFRCYA